MNKYINEYIQKVLITYKLHLLKFSKYHKYAFKLQQKLKLLEIKQTFDDNLKIIP